MNKKDGVLMSDNSKRSNKTYKFFIILAIISCLNFVTVIAWDNLDEAPDFFADGVVFNTFEKITGGYEYEQVYNSPKLEKSYLPGGGYYPKIGSGGYTNSKNKSSSLTNIFLDLIQLVLNLWFVWLMIALYMKWRSKKNE